MATRNRTTAYLNFRQTYRRRSLSDSEHRPSPTDGQKSLLQTAPGDIEMGVMQYEVPPSWVSTVEQINDHLNKIEIRLKELNAAQSKHLLPTFEDMGDTEQEVEVITNDLSRLFKTCESKIRLIGKEMAEKEKAQQHSEAKVLKNLQAQLAQKLGQLFSQFRKSQKQYLSKLKGQQKMESDFVQIDKGQDDELVDMGFTTEQSMLVNINDDLLREREEEISKITDSIEDLAMLFRDLQNLIIDQGTILDRIDYNIEQTQADVTVAVEQLTKAEKTQKKNKLMLCIYILMLAIGALTLALIIKHA